ncbi:hypothetical protein B5F74_05785 [Collinsella sp. An271]|uniref:Mur ligase family protein n=1 Tax=Collinsella sp. An271 TaxID=1965616 RepID=UPI000B36BDF6|nr:UDP-N-acetylmuramoyl-L-alanyl-D-glutamate--2,6-diaminopimelate ligase [Collinsella sp. An271]OUO61162.1 hypothetical protein B5F74_05785 [Collinsella sp. An271]
MPAAIQQTYPLEHYLSILAQDGNLLQAPEGAGELEIRCATDDSREAVPGTLFVCKGAAFKREYLVDACGAGAVAYVSTVDYGVDAPCVLVRDIRRALGLLADAAYDHPSARTQVCAFTGTKGKTTCVYYLRSILAEHARRNGAAAPAFLTGVEFDDGAERGESLLTTPEPFTLERRIANAAASGCQQIVMEASSQALKFHRTLGIEFAVGAFTNFGEDHISPIEHPTLEDYFASKLMLFNNCRVAVVNLDMDVADRVLEAARSCGRVLTYSLSDVRADIHALGAVRGDSGLRARVQTPAGVLTVDLPTPATFNLSNALAAIACAVALGVEGASIERGLKAVRVPGRMEMHRSDDGRIVGVVDYAHNGMSLEMLLRELRQTYPEREIAVVFGSTGGKGVDRRETMGEAAGKFADRIVITEDDPGPENPADICDAIARAVAAQGNENWKIVLDRAEAIRTIVRETSGPAVIVVAGKGDDAFMLRNGVREPYEPDNVQLDRALGIRRGSAE